VQTGKFRYTGDLPENTRVFFEIDGANATGVSPA